MVGPSRTLGAGVIALSLALAVASACGGTQTATLSDLGGVPELKARFNADAGKARIVLLLSPT